MKLSKSLLELDAAADELLMKSEKDKEKVGPEDVSGEYEEPEPEEEEKDEKELLPEDGGTKGGGGKPEDEDEEEEEDDEEEEEDDEEEDDDERSEDAEAVAKSIRASFEMNPFIGPQISSSEYMNATVEILSKAIADVTELVSDGSRTNMDVSSVLAKGLSAQVAISNAQNARMEKMEKKLTQMQKSIKQMVGALDKFGAQPAHMRKSVAAVKPVERDFNSSLGGRASTNATGLESLSKSQVLEILVKEVEAGNDRVTPEDVMQYEAGGILSAMAKGLVISRLNGK